MFYFTLHTPNTLESIPKELKDSSSQRRSLFHMAVIDDQPFEYADILQKHQFQLSELGDIQDFNSLASYPIIVCDIKGVGKKFGSQFEGAHVIKEIHKRYPDKYIIGFSGATYKGTYKEFFDCCDLFIKKDADSSEWVACLDNAIRAVADPVRRWQRIRSFLLNTGLPIFEVFLLEQAYIKSIRKQNESILAKAFLKTKDRYHSQNKELFDYFSSTLSILIKVGFAIVDVTP